MNEERINKRSSTFDKTIFILRYIFFGFLIWSYFSTMYTIIRKGAIGGVFALVAVAMFFIFKEGINPIKMNNREFGKFTDIIGLLISLIFVICCLAPLFGVGFYK